MAEDAKQAQFGTTAIKLGLVTPGQVEECLSIQTQMRGMGISETLGELLIKKGYLNPAAQTQVLKAMGVDVSPVPGYKLLAKLGQGAMGTVYKAQHLKMNRTVALKVIKAELSKDAGFLERFFREARAAAKLTHPNIISAFDVAETGGIYYFVMEYVEGQPLSAVLKKSGKLPPKSVVAIIIQAARALECIAGHGMVHRDVKPENLMMTKDGTIKLCDFGLAKEVDENVHLTMTGWTMGTPLYMSPEQIRGQKDIDLRADIYALGATAYHALCGRPPFLGENPGEVVSKHLTEPVPPMRKQAPEIPENLARIVEKCLRKKREERYAAPADLIADLERFQSGEKPLAAIETRRVPKATAPVRRTVPIAVGAAAVALVLGLILAFRGGSEPAAQKDPQVEKPKGPTEEDVRASELIARAEELLRQENWADAQAALEELTTTYREAEPVAKKMSALTQALADCKLKIEGARQAREERLQKARAHMQLEEWVQAEAVLRELGSAPEILEMLKTCKSELECRQDIAAARALLDGGEWDKAARAIQGILARHEGRRTLAPVRPALESDLELCSAEREAAAALQRIWSLELEKKWDELLKEIRAVEEKHGRTRTVLAAAEKIRAAKGQVMRAQAEAVRRDAEAQWKKAVEAFKAEDYKAAETLFVAYRKDYEDADFYAERRKDLDTHLAQCAEKFRQARERDAEATAKSADTLYSGKKYEEAASKYHDVMEDFRETEFVKRNAKRFETRIKECEKAMGKASTGRVFEDFEKGVGGWTVSGTAAKPAAISVVKEDRKGKNALRMLLPAGDDKTKYAWGNVILPVEGLPADTASIRFWIRLTKGSKMTFAFDVAQPNRESTTFLTYRSKFDVTSEWKQVTLDLSKMELVWYGTGEKPPLDLRKVSRIGFYRYDAATAVNTQYAQAYTNNDPNAEFVVLVDEIEFVKKK